MTEGMQYNPSYMKSTNPDYEDVSDVLPEQNLNTIEMQHNTAYVMSQN